MPDEKEDVIIETGPEARKALGLAGPLIESTELGFLSDDRHQERTL